MTIATWPAELPKPLREGFSLGYEDGRLSKGGEAPVPGFRGRFSRPARPQRMMMRLYPPDARGSGGSSKRRSGAAPSRS
ncbi:hypothetical protein [Methylobrevis pamukkalensis]|uniref:Uncharacterized protein n=1 Tax=Methylobrevis pamukkalensis TaxID=1439726 RepID=A0A1E3GYA9_9HYPH|nr:hypothetical protein [Methylobrevis pamukkalensis]ODN68546.1 hypothetical protein A6302_04159 [Methylobrevis pamukkalensis]